MSFIHKETISSSFTEIDNRFETQFTIAAPGFYRLWIQFEPLPNACRCSVYIDGLTYGWVLLPSEGCGAADEGSVKQMSIHSTDSHEACMYEACTVFLDGGEHTLTIKDVRGTIRLLRVQCIPAAQPEREFPSFELVNPKASVEARKLMRYLSTIYGRKILAGQHTNSASGPEFEHIRSITGKLPALKGFDLLSYSHCTATEHMSKDAMAEVAGNRGSIEKAIEWYKEQGGIVTICWHWYAPTGGEDKAFYTQHTDFDLIEALRPDSAAHAALLRDMDAIAEQLTRLRDARVPVLWRPLHEADGGWFWWGAKGPEAYKALYKLMFHRYVVEHRLNNLIWVWNAPHPDWYPGDDYVDLAGDDIYEPNGNYGPLLCAYEYAVSLTKGRKPVALTENGPIPDPDLLRKNRADWLWYMPWWGHWCIDGEVTSKEQLIKTYHHPDVVTLEDLPDFAKY